MVSRGLVAWYMAWLLVGVLGEAKGQEASRPNSDGGEKGLMSIPFDEYFTGKGLRLEYFQGGNAKESMLTLHQMHRTAHWAGNPQQLMYPFPYGKYRVRVLNGETEKLIFSQGFDTLFAEYATTDPALKGISRTFPVCVRIPCPKGAAKIVIDHRLRDNSWEQVFASDYRPDDYNIIEEASEPFDEVIALSEVGEPKHCLDIVFLAEGYSESRRQAFLEDARRLFDYLLEQAPFRDYRDKINATCIFRASRESGTDEPRQYRFRATALHSSFNALDTDRYLLVEDAHGIHRMAAQAAYDCPVVLVDSERYGGGAICLDNCVTTTHHELSGPVFVHEFAHALAYLADEYVGNVSYNDIYPEGVEPVEPNLTRRLERDKIKWKHLLTDEVPLPTTGKAERDAGKRMVGAFEGGGYVKNRIYRPQRECRMGSNGFQIGYCVVCEEAIRKMLDYYTAP